jgi:hypothetical protein
MAHPLRPSISLTHQTILRRVFIDLDASCVCKTHVTRIRPFWLDTMAPHGVGMLVVVPAIMAGGTIRFE